MIHQNQDPGQGLCEFLLVPGPDFQERNSVLPEYYQKPNEELPVDLIACGEEEAMCHASLFLQGWLPPPPTWPTSSSRSPSKASSKLSTSRIQAGMQGVYSCAWTLQFLKKLGPHTDDVYMNNGPKSWEAILAGFGKLSYLKDFISSFSTSVVFIFEREKGGNVNTLGLFLFPSFGFFFFFLTKIRSCCFLQYISDSRIAWKSFFSTLMYLQRKRLRIFFKSPQKFTHRKLIWLFNPEWCLRIPRAAFGSRLIVIL